MATSYAIGPGEKAPVTLGPGASLSRSAVAWILLCVVGPFLVVALASPRMDLFTGEALVITVLTLYSGTHLARLYGRGELRIAATTFWLFVYTAMSLASLARISTGLHSYLETSDTLTEAALLTLVGCVAYDLSYFVHLRNTRSHVDVRPLREIDFTRVNVIAVLGIGASVYYVGNIGLATFFSSRSALIQSLAQAGLTTDSSQTAAAVVGSLGTVPVLLAWVAWTARLSRDAAARRSLQSWTWYLLLSAVMVVVNNPISNSRYWMLTVALATLFCLPNLGPRYMRAAISGGVLLAVIVFPYSDYFRVDASLRPPLQINSVSTELATKDYDQMTMIANGIWYADALGHTNGSQAVADLLFFVPHSLWSGRSTDTGVILGRAMNVPNVNLSAPLWLELWLDFGWVGLIAGFLALGKISSQWDGLFVQVRSRLQQAAPTVLDVALPFFVGYQFILLRGPLLQAMGRLVFMAILLIVIRGRARKADTGPNQIRNGL